MNRRLIHTWEFAMSIFDDVRERVSMQDAVNYLGLTLTRKEGDQLRFPCPTCKGTD